MIARKTTAVWRGALLACALAWLGCSAADEAPAGDSTLASCGVPWDGEARRVPVVLVMSDTLRGDRLGAAGGPARTPAYDGFAAEALVFTDAHSAAPWTKPAIASLFTGLYPSQHGVLTHPDLRARPAGAVDASDTPMTDGLAGELTTLAELFQRAGYATAGIVANPWLGPDYGFAQGFDAYDHRFAGNDTPGERITEAALAWLAERDATRPFFLYLHYMDAHGPYPAITEERIEAVRETLEAEASELTPAARRNVARLARDEAGKSLLGRGIPPSPGLAALAYDGGVEQFDRALGDLLRGLDESLGESPVAVVVTSDHGESLFERGRGGHGHSLYPEELGIPLALRLPGVASGRVSCPVSLLDVMATLTRYAGLETPEHDHGRPLLLRQGDPGSGGLAIGEAVIGKPGRRALVTATHRVVHRPDAKAGEARWSVFERGADPGERLDLGEARVPAELRERLLAGVPEWEGASPSAVPMDAETRERLEALGYLGAEP
ncbi:MAG: sulfatase [Myxococcota bacterium]|nr:sulfatase [Myxococcota bacterium]